MSKHLALARGALFLEIDLWNMDVLLLKPNVNFIRPVRSR